MKVDMVKDQKFSPRTITFNQEEAEFMHHFLMRNHLFLKRIYVKDGFHSKDMAEDMKKVEQLLGKFK